jgi:predicted transcriptional regulator
MARIITEQDLANAKRLKAVYEAKKGELGLTQTKVGELLGMKQGAVAQYINGHIALNYEATIEFARVLDVKPWDIDASLGVLVNKKKITEQETIVNVRETLSGSGKPQKTNVTIGYSGMADHLQGYEADSDSFSPFLKKGDVIVIDRSLQPEPGDDVLIEFASGGKTVGELVDHDAKQATFKSYAGGEIKDRPLSDIASYDVIIDIKKETRPHTRRLRIAKTTA